MDTLLSFLFAARFLVIVAVFAVVIIYLLRGRFTHRKWLKISTRIIGGLLILPTFVALALLTLMLACTPRPRIIRSPDLKHVAAYSYFAGFLGRDSSLVTVRSKWSIFPEAVYEYAGPSDWEGTEVHWLPNDQLMIRYHADPLRIQHCRTQGAGVKVQCVPVTP
jgi:hypothetical protein